MPTQSPDPGTMVRLAIPPTSDVSTRAIAFCLLACRDRGLGELHELLELRVQEKILVVYGAWHGEFSCLEV